MNLWWGSPCRRIYLLLSATVVELSAFFNKECLFYAKHHYRCLCLNPILPLHATHHHHPLLKSIQNCIDCTLEVQQFNIPIYIPVCRNSINIPSIYRRASSSTPVQSSVQCHRWVHKIWPNSNGVPRTGADYYCFYGISPRSVLLPHWANDDDIQWCPLAWVDEEEQEDSIGIVLHRKICLNIIVPL